MKTAILLCLFSMSDMCSCADNSAALQALVEAIHDVHEDFSNHLGYQVEVRGNAFLFMKRDELAALNDPSGIDDLTGKIIKGLECVIIINESEETKKSISSLVDRSTALGNPTEMRDIGKGFCAVLIGAKFKEWQEATVKRAVGIIGN